MAINLSKRLSKISYNHHIEFFVPNEATFYRLRAITKLMSEIFIHLDF